MNRSISTIKARRNFFVIAAICLLFLATSDCLLAQHKGAPVKRDRLIRALRSKQLQTRDIVAVINSNGVDFELTAEVKKALVGAGARPEVIKAVSDNQRVAEKNSVVAKTENKNVKRAAKTAPPDYDDLIERAIYSYKEQKNPNAAVKFLQTAARLKPKGAEAQQMLGFVYLYGLNDFAKAETAMRESVANGGSAVFRVFHDDGDFKRRCSGSLYISQDALRFESDDNIHTFETAVVNVDKIKLDDISTRFWKKHSTFKIFLKIGKDKAKFRFAPLTGKQAESKMVERFAVPPNPAKNSVAATVTSSR